MAENEQTIFEFDLGDYGDVIRLRSPEELRGWNDKEFAAWQWVQNARPSSEHIWNEHHTFRNQMQRFVNDWSNARSNPQQLNSVLGSLTNQFDHFYCKRRIFHSTAPEAAFIKKLGAERGDTVAAGAYSRLLHAPINLGSPMQADFVAGLIEGFLYERDIDWTASAHQEVLNRLKNQYAGNISHQDTRFKEMRNAAGDSGEFYTPRAVVRFMVAVTDPRLGERVMDPASGTGGFLVEAYNHLAKQVKAVADRRVLQEKSLFGCVPKPLPYLLYQMNLLLHGLDAPQIDPGNALRHKLTECWHTATRRARPRGRDPRQLVAHRKVFGGEEERGIQGNFPEDKQTAETALLFLQLIMRKLKRVGTISTSSQTLSNRGRGGTRPYQVSRAAVVVPNGTLFGDGVCARIKEELLKEFNLHTIVRLPNGVFAPYTSIPTNLLFFDRSGPTREVWYYEQPLPEGRKNYTKTAPIQFEEFATLCDWWDQPGPGTKRKETDQAWKVSAAELLANGCNLDRKNPRAKEDITHLRRSSSPPTS